MVLLSRDGAFVAGEAAISCRFFSAFAGLLGIAGSAGAGTAATGATGDGDGFASAAWKGTAGFKLAAVWVAGFGVAAVWVAGFGVAGFGVAGFAVGVAVGVAVAGFGVVGLDALPCWAAIRGDDPAAAAEADRVLLLEAGAVLASDALGV
jgi:hypothetical protein